MSETAAGAISGDQMRFTEIYVPCAKAIDPTPHQNDRGRFMRPAQPMTGSSPSSAIAAAAACSAAMIVSWVVTPRSSSTPRSGHLDRREVSRVRSQPRHALCRLGHKWWPRDYRWHCYGSRS